ncbi:MAG: serpin family protein [Erythrobacter sp.]
MIRRLATALTATFLASCTTTPGGDQTGASQGEAATDSQPADGATASAAQLFPLLDAEAGPAENLFYSPLSIDYAFGIVALGARGETARQLASILPPPRSAGEYTSNADGVELRLASRLWVNSEFSVAPDFTQAARRRYDAGAEEIDIGAPDTSARRMNAWADENTDGLIQQIVNPGEITPDIALFVTNAILFDGDWARTFGGSAEKPFLFGDGTEQPFRLMQERLTLRTVDRGEWRAVRLPYAGGRYAMDVIMPDRREVMTAAPDLETIAEIDDALAGTDAQLVDMELPRFEIETDLALIEPLQALGLTLPFDRSHADLSGIGSGWEQNLYVSGAKQLARLQVFETGTRAAAVTVVGVSLTSAPPPDLRSAIPFTVDRPFLAIIRDLENDTMLFLGRIAAPKAYQPQDP